MKLEEVKALKKGDRVMLSMFCDSEYSGAGINMRIAESDATLGTSVWLSSDIDMQCLHDCTIEQIRATEQENKELHKTIASLEEQVAKLKSMQEEHLKQIKEQEIMLAKGDTMINDLVAQNKELLEKHEELSDDSRIKMCLDWAVRMAKVLNNKDESNG